MKQQRIRGWEKILIFLWLSLDAWYIFIEPVCMETYYTQVVIGYLILFVAYPLSKQQKANVSKREMYMTIFLSWVIMNIGIALVMMACGTESSMEGIWIRIGLLILAGGAGLFFMLIAGKVIRKVCHKEEEIKLLLYGKKDEKELLSDGEKSESAFKKAVCQYHLVDIDSPIEELERQIERYDKVYILDIPAQRRNDLLKLCVKLEKPVYCLSKLSDILIQGGLTVKEDDRPYFYCDKYRLNRSERFVKRCMDVICSGLALLVLWPVFLIVAIGIKLEDGGPVIYKQTRCTRDGKEFEIFKFRSMVLNAEPDGAVLASTGDKRITKIGQFLRNTKIDELPQLINILRGDMSIVGPRPERPELITQIKQEVPEFEYRMKVKAGLTGYAQVQGNYLTSPLDKLKWDLMYINQYSLVLDLKIIMMTPFVIFIQNNRED